MNSTPSPTLPRAFANRLQIEQFSDLIRRHGAGLGAQADQRGEVANAPVQFGEQHKGGGGIARWVDQQGACLPFLGGEVYRIDKRPDLRFERLGLLDLHRDGADLVDGRAGQRGNLRLVIIGEWVTKVEYEHTISKLSF